MIPIQEQPEPSDFSNNVRRPGAAFLKEVARPTKWDKKEYWQKALPDLYQAFVGICVYSAHWIPRDTGVATVDHFIPKSIAPQLAYEWSNFRLASLKMNSRKGNFQDVIDPFKVEPNWFVMDFPSMLIKPNPTLSASLKGRIQATIKRLKLNDDETCVKARTEWLLPFCKSGNQDSFEHLKKHAPFIAYELQRQNLIDKIASIMGV